jgi:hypothetical protein
MTLPHQTGLVRESSQRPDSVEAAEAHARAHAYWLPGRIEWTTGNVVRLVLLVSAGLAAVAGVAVWGWSLGAAAVDPPTPPAYTVDTATPRGALGAYFVALDRGEELAAVDLLCRSAGRDFDQARFVEITAAPLRLEPVGSMAAMEPWPVLLGDAQPLGDGSYVVAATNSTGTTGHFLVTEESRGYRVCGFA